MFYLNLTYKLIAIGQKKSHASFHYMFNSDSYYFFITQEHKELVYAPVRHPSIMVENKDSNSSAEAEKKAMSEEE